MVEYTLIIIGIIMILFIAEQASIMATIGILLTTLIIATLPFILTIITLLIIQEAIILITVMATITSITQIIITIQYTQIITPPIATQPATEGHYHQKEIEELKITH